MLVRELIIGLGFDVEDEKLKSFSDKFGGVLNVVGAASLAVAGLGAVFLKTAGDMEQTEIAFETMLGSAEKAQALLKDISDFAARTPFERTEVIAYSKQLLAYGTAAEEIIPTMESLGNIAAGVGKDKLGSIVLAFGKVQTKGKASMEELNILLEAGVPVLDELAKKFNVSKEQVIKMASSGKISFNDLNDSMRALSSGTGKFSGLMEKQSRSFLGIVSNIQDMLTTLAIEIGQELLPYAKDLGAEFIEWFDANKAFIKQGLIEFFKKVAFFIGYVVVAFQKLIQDAGGMEAIVKKLNIALNILTGVLGFVLKTAFRLRGVILALTLAVVFYNYATKAVNLANSDAVKSFVKLIMNIRKAGVAQWALNAAMSANPIGLIVAAIALAVAEVALLWYYWDQIPGILKLFVMFASPLLLWAGIIKIIAENFDRIVAVVKQKLEPVMRRLKEAFAAIYKAAEPIITDLKKAFPTLFDGIGDPTKLLGDGLVKLIELVATVLSVALGGVAKMIELAVGGVEKLVGVYEGAKRFFGFSDKKKQAPAGGNSGGVPGVPKYAKGTPYVPNDQYAFLHKGEAVIPAGVMKDMRGARGAGGTQININSSVELAVPEGTPAAQSEGLKALAREAVRKEWQGILRDTSFAFAGGQ